MRLPATFRIFPATCGCGYNSEVGWELEGVLIDGVWRKTINRLPRLKNVGDGYLQCRDCCDVVQRQPGWTVYLCPTCERERWHDPAE